MPSNSAKIGRSKYASRFARVEGPRVPRSVFNRSSGRKQTFDAGVLVPFFCDEVLPGDTFRGRATILARLNTPIRPFMDNLYLDWFWFFVPNRLVWDNWEKFMGDQDDPANPDYSFTVPKLEPGSIASGSLADYLGLPHINGNAQPTAFPFRGYNLIWNEWFRDQNHAAKAVIPTGDGPDPWGAQNTVLKRTFKRHDYFTSALPWAQKGPQVGIGIGGQAPILGTLDDNSGSKGNQPTFDTTGEALGLPMSRAPGNSVELAGASGAYADVLWNSPNLTFDGSSVYADLSAATAYSINQLRQAATLQQLYERDARGGTRYTEILRNHFGVQPADARLNRPELIGMGTQVIAISTVEQTSESSQSSPLGYQAAYGISVNRHKGWTKSFPEHGYVFGLLRVRADQTYQYGADRHWCRQTKEEYFWPTLAHMGEQVIQKGELWTDGSDEDRNPWGFQERYAEYRYKQSSLAGQLNERSVLDLDEWHLAEEHATRPELNQTFLEENPPLDRVLAIKSDTEPPFTADIWIDLKCIRPIPVYGTPGISRL